MAALKRAVQPPSSFVRSGFTAPCERRRRLTGNAELELRDEPDTVRRMIDQDHVINASFRVPDSSRTSHIVGAEALAVKKLDRLSWRGLVKQVDYDQIRHRHANSGENQLPASRTPRSHSIGSADGAIAGLVANVDVLAGDVQVSVADRVRRQGTSAGNGEVL